MTKIEDKVLAVICVVLLVCSIGFFSFIKSEEKEKKEEEEEVKLSADGMLAATNAFLASGKSTMITAEALYVNLNDNYAGNDPFILSVRSETQYAIGHIPGAVNIPWTRVFTEENLSKLPTNKQIVVYCYTGHTASQITALLNLMDYDAVCLKWGMCSWTTNETVTGNAYYTAPTSAYPTVTGSTPGTWTTTGSRCGGDEPTSDPAPADSGGEAEEVDLGAGINAYLSSGKPPAIMGQDLSDNLNDGDSNNNPFVLSIRSSSQYEIGHIPGAINIGFKTLFTEENLSKLPDDNTQIVVVCYTGHTASQATALLNVNGYNATALKWGMSGWSSNSTIAPSAYNKATDCHNYPTSLGEDAGDLDSAVIADTAEVILGATNDFLSAGKSTMITAEALYNNLNDNYASNDPFILSVRSESQYAIGHIPGAVNIPWTSVFTEENISKLPINKDIVVYCFTGHTASQVTAMLNVLGYDAMCLKFGMVSWTFNSTVAPAYYDPATVTDYPVVSGDDPGNWTMGTRQGCGDDVDTDGGEVEQVTGSIFDITRTACNNYLGLGKPAAIKASSLYETLNDGNSSNDPFLLSIRSSSQYGIGHVGGAVNMGFSSLFDEENLAKLPTDKQIVVICYTGHTASQATALLNINGFDAVPLKFGMNGWTTNATIAPSAYDRETACHNYPVVVGDEPGVLADGILAATEKVVLDATKAFLGAGKSTQITAEAVYNNLNDNYASNDPFILSIRSASQYAKGHIPSAVNIPYKSLFTEENISLLPTNKDIVVYCYTGHTASQATAMLNVMGYDAKCLKFGMCSWTTDSTITAGACYDKEKHAFDYPVATGSDPGAWAVGTRQGCDDPGGGGDDVSELTGTTTEIVRAACNNYQNAGKPSTMKADALYETLNDGNTSNDPFILSIRSSSQYSIGHIPGAVNIGMSVLFEDENLAKLPDDDRLIVVVCYTGHTASQTTALLNINGYNATALKFGMTSWSTDTIIAPMGFDKVLHASNHPVCSGTDTGTLATGFIADTASIVLEATNAFLSAGKGTQITAEALYANLNDGYAGNDPFILSIRKADAYAGGHIPGAVNIPLASLFTDENISSLPTNKQIVVYCYTGHTASQATAMLNVLGFDAVCLKFGMCSWTTNTTIAPSCYDPSTVTNYPVVTGANPGTWADNVGTRQGCDDPTNGGTTEAVAGSVFDIVRATCKNFLGEGKPSTMKANDLYTLLDDSDTSNDPFILSIRAASQYAVGHIAGAVNIGMSSLFQPENLDQLPDDDTLIVVVCYTGHTASQTTALLNINGYNATALKFGMTGWTTNATVAPYAYNKGKNCHNYPVTIGVEVGNMTDAVIVGKTDEEILLDAVSAYVENGYKTIKAPDLQILLNDTDPNNDPFILSIRSAEHYAIGHIPGAINIPWRGLFATENLSQLPGNNTPIVVVCYTGHGASQITALLNVLGYNASTLIHGMSSWTTNTTIAPSGFNATKDQGNYSTCNGTQPGSMATATRGRNGCGDNGGGTVTFEGSVDEWEILRQACERYLTEVVKMTITDNAVYNNLNDSYSTNDPYILSIRTSTNTTGTPHYELGHIPGAINIGYKSLFTEENLSTLPTDKQIVVVCYTGHTASQTTALLNILGYDAITLKFGMCSWTENSTINAGKCYTVPTYNYRTTLGQDKGEWDEAEAH